MKCCVGKVSVFPVFDFTMSHKKLECYDLCYHSVFLVDMAESTLVPCCR